MADIYSTAGDNTRKVPATATWLYNSSFIWIGITGYGYDWTDSPYADNAEFEQMINTINFHISVEMLNDSAKVSGTDSTCLIAVNGSNFTGDAVINAEDGVNGVQYKIITAGDTDYTTIGAADSNVGTVFTAATIANASGTTGTMRPYNDTIQTRIEESLDAKFTSSTHIVTYPMTATNTSNGWA